MFFSTGLDEQIDPALLAFVKCHVTSPLKWEALRVLAAQNGEWLRIEQLAQATHKPLVELTPTLAELVSEGVLEVDPAERAELSTAAERAHLDRPAPVDRGRHAQPGAARDHRGVPGAESPGAGGKERACSRLRPHSAASRTSGSGSAVGGSFQRRGRRWPALSAQDQRRVSHKAAAFGAFHGRATERLAKGVVVERERLFQVESGADTRPRLELRPAARLVLRPRRCRGRRPGRCRSRRPTRRAWAAGLRRSVRGARWSGRRCSARRRGDRARPGHRSGRRPGTGCTNRSLWRRACRSRGRLRSGAPPGTRTSRSG